jgi:hypothetical protein
LPKLGKDQSLASLAAVAALKSDDGATINYVLYTKDFRASGLGQVRRLTVATAAITLARLFLEMLCYVLGRLYSSCVLSSRIGLHRIKVINKTFVNDDFSKQFSNFLFIHV